MTRILIDSKIFAYLCSYQRDQDLMETLNAIEHTVKYYINANGITNYKVVVVRDVGKSSYREQLLGSYKKHRDVDKKSLATEQKEKYHEFQRSYAEDFTRLLEVEGIRHLGVQGVEADDLISILAHKYTYNGEHVVIFSEDHDLFQIVLENPNTSIVLPRSSKELFKKDIQEMEGIKNTLGFLFKKAVLGDSGDGIKGLKNCGETCFRVLLKYYDNLSTKSYEELKYIYCNYRSILEDLHKKLPKGTFRLPAEFKLPDKYPAKSFEELFDLNIKLGRTMTDLTLFTREQKQTFLDVMTKRIPQINLEKYRDTCISIFGVLKNDFGDSVDFEPHTTLINGNAL